MAQRVAGQFPDGQLYVNLHGFSPGSPVAPVEALVRRFARQAAYFVTGGGTYVLNRPTAAYRYVTP